MAKMGEINYLRNLNETGRRFAINLPFSYARCDDAFMEVGAIMALLPPPPARLLDLGCGTGWTSRFFARRGYQVLGVDIAPDMIEAARELAERENVGNLEFLISDYENMKFETPFDCAVFYASLHHAVDEHAALNAVYQALRPGGVCVASEPGRGHARAEGSVNAIAKFDTTEKDMPPGLIKAAGRRAGFRKFRVYPHAYHLASTVYRPRGKVERLVPSRPAWLRSLCMLVCLNAVRVACRFRSGIVVLTK